MHSAPDRHHAGIPSLNQQVKGKSIRTIHVLQYIICTYAANSQMLKSTDAINTTCFNQLQTAWQNHRNALPHSIIASENEYQLWLDGEIHLRK